MRNGGLSMPMGRRIGFARPDIAAFTDFWFSEPIVAPLFGFDGDWRQSLVKRSLNSE
jgi:hypothetical protein